MALSTLRDVLVLAAALCAPTISAAEPQHQQFYRWTSPDLGGASLMRRQTPPPGYHPEFGTCGSGTTCENACGSNWLSCKASTDLSLFCYNKVQLNQTCCENGSGRACDNGYYCAWKTFGGRVWCCKNGQSLKECGVEDGTTTPGGTTTSTTSTKTDTKTDVTTTTSTTTSRTGPPPPDPTGPATCPSCPNGGGSGTATVTVTATSVSTVTSALSGTLVLTSTITVYTNLPPGISTITVISTVAVTVTETTTTTAIPEGCTGTLPPPPTTTGGGGGGGPTPTKGHSGYGTGHGPTVTGGYGGQHPDLVAVVIDETRSGYITAVATGGGQRLAGSWGLMAGMVMAGLVAGLGGILV